MRLVRIRSAPALARARAKYWPKSAAGAGNECDLTGEIEEWAAHRIALDSCAGENDFHQVGLAGVKAIEPARAFFKRCNGGDERLDTNLSGGHEFDRLRIFAG